MTNHRDTALGDEEEFDRFAKSAGASLRRDAPPGGAATVMKAGDRHRTRQRLGVAIGGAAVIVASVSAWGPLRDNTSTVDTTPVVTAPIPDTSTSTTRPADTSIAPDSTLEAAPASIAEPASGVVPLTDLPDDTPIEDGALQAFDLGYKPAYVTATEDAIWTSDLDLGALKRISFDGAETASVDGAQIYGNIQICRPAIAFGAVWTVRQDRLTKTDLETLKVTNEIQLPGRSTGDGAFMSDLAIEPSGVWVLTHDADGAWAVRIDPTTDGVSTKVFVGAAGRSVAVGAGSLWVTRFGDGSAVTRHDPATGDELARINLDFAPGSIVASDTSVWVSGQRGSDPFAPDGPLTVARIDPTTDSIAASVEIGGPGDSSAFSDIALGATSTWITTRAGVVRIDHSTNRVAARYAGVDGGGVSAADGRVWVTDVRTQRLYEFAE